jgi:NADPH:quinone reductase
MKAIVMTSTGGPEVLVRQEVPTPRPAENEVLIRVEAAAVLFVETQLRSGVFPLPGATPAVFGTQAAGVVIEVGSAVDESMIGTRVLLAGMGIGAYAEQVCAPALSAAPIPEGLSAVDAVAVTMGGSVALTLLDRAQLTGLETVLIEAAGTGVGGYLTQLAKKRGASQIIATAGSSHNRERARTLGADHVVDHSNIEWPRRMRELLNDNTIDVAFESLGGETAAAVLDSMTPLVGRMLFYGLLSGAPAAISSQDLLARGLTLTGCGGPVWLSRVAAARTDILQMAADGEITPLIDSVIPLELARYAHEQIEKRNAKGMFVLTP